MILKAHPIPYVCLEDGSETTVSSALLSSARRSCRYSCEGASLANVYYALKAVTEGQFKCKCVDTSFTSIIAEEGQYTYNPIITFLNLIIIQSFVIYFSTIEIIYLSQEYNP